MVASPKCWARLANYILLYDQIVIPTGDLQILPVLRLVLGEDVFDNLIRNKGIVLARFDQWFAYVGNGGGLKLFRVSDNPNTSHKGPVLGIPSFKPIDEAIDNILSITNPSSSPERRRELKNLLLDNVVNLPAANNSEELKNETYNDILNSEYLREFLCLRNAGRSLDHLVGIAPNHVMVFNPHIPHDPMYPLEIRSVLRVAFENFLLKIGGYCEVTEVTGDESTITILRAKGQRLGFSPDGNQAFVQIQQVSGVPDLGAAFASKQLSVTQLLDLRYSKHCQALRDWFAQGSPSESAEMTVRRYVESLGKPSWIDSIPMKMLRFGVTAAIGAIEPVSALVASVADNFLLSKWFPGKSPRLFMKHAKVILSSTPLIAKPVMRGRDRNHPCSCGSGKKFKRCCGA
jgi:hypothetical protein